MSKEVDKPHFGQLRTSAINAMTLGNTRKNVNIEADP